MSLNSRMAWGGVLVSMAGWAAAQPVAAADSVLLKPKFTSGQTQYKEVDAKLKIKMKGGQFGPGEMEFGIHQLYGVLLKVDSTSPESTSLTLTFDRAWQGFQSPMMDADFDSDDSDNEDASPQMSSVLMPMIGMHAKMKLNDEGHVTAFSGMEDIIKKITKEAAGNPFAMQLRRELTDDRAKLKWGEMQYVVYPFKEVKVGDTWTKTLNDENPQIGKLILRYDCKLDRISEEGGRRMAVVTYSGVTDSDAKATPTSGPAGKSKAHGKFSGTAMFDIERGEFVKAEHKGELKVEQEGAGKDKDGKASTQTFEQTAAVTTVLLSEADRAKQKEGVKAKQAAKKSEEEKKQADRKARRAAKKAEKDGDEKDEDKDSKKEDKDE